jgi:hypothetical protein
MGAVTQDSSYQALKDVKLDQLAGEAITPGSIYTHDMHLEPILQAVSDTAIEQADALDDIFDALRVKGIRLTASHFRNDIAPIFKQVTLEAIQDGLFEYYLYSQMGYAKVKELYGKGVTSGAGMGQAARDELDGTANAMGGSIVGMNPDGTAKILRAPAGEAPAFVGAGERIVPAGGGGGANVNVNVQLQMLGDLKRMIEVVSQQVLVDHLRANTSR